MAVPVRAELLASLASCAARLAAAALRHVERRRSELRNAARALPMRDRLLSVARQRLDGAAQSLHRAAERKVERRRSLLADLARRMAGRSPRARSSRSRGSV